MCVHIVDKICAIDLNSIMYFLIPEGIGNAHKINKGRERPFAWIVTLDHTSNSVSLNDTLLQLSKQFSVCVCV